MFQHYPCQRYRTQSLSRRAMLQQCSSGFAALALSALSLERSFATDGSELGRAGHGPHHAVRAKNVIFLYMDGGPSQIDTFDPKPLLDKYNGRDPGELFTVEPTQFNNNGKVLASPWKFKQHGESGLPVSSLFPHIATCADDLAVIRSLTSEFPEHTFANYFLHTGSGLQPTSSATKPAPNRNVPNLMWYNSSIDSLKNKSANMMLWSRPFETMSWPFRCKWPFPK